MTSYYLASLLASVLLTFWLYPWRYKLGYNGEHPIGWIWMSVFGLSFLHAAIVVLSPAGYAWLVWRVRHGDMRTRRQALRDLHEIFDADWARRALDAE